MVMDDRKRWILQTIVDDYIDSAEPIGSRTIARKHELGLSSATIRNEMADLEEMGYLVQPHTSAGRAPSDKGYRLYVDELMEIRELNTEEIARIRIEMETRISELSQLIRQASAVLSRFTKYTSVAVTPPLRRTYLKAIQVVPIDTGKAMVVVFTNAGTVRNSLVILPENVSDDMLIVISNILKSKLKGTLLDRIDVTVADDLEIEFGLSREITAPILEGIRYCIDKGESSEVFVEGTTNIFNHPEFRDIVKARNFMSILDEKPRLSKLFCETTEPDRINVRIGNENDMNGVKEYSIVTTSYNMADTIIGSIGIIGPTRMEYPRVISTMRYLKKLMDKEVSNLLGIDADKEK